MQGFTDPDRRKGEEIVVCDEYFPTGTPVVLWSDPGGYDAYLEHRFFEPGEVYPSADDDRDTPRRYNDREAADAALAARVEAEGWTLDNLREQLRLFVIHYDVCVVSRECFRVLHDVRGLSVHFMLDVDGTVYQTLDLRERGRHSGPANNPSIGVEIAHIGAYDPDDETPSRWYGADDDGATRVVLPEKWGDGGVRTPGYVARPSRPGLFEGRIHDRPLQQYDFTEEQYRALAGLTATLCSVFPLMRPDAPRSPDGTIRPDRLSDDEIAAYGGLLGHWHLTTNKIDPGPAFDWERVFHDAATIAASRE